MGLVRLVSPPPVGRGMTKWLNDSSHGGKKARATELATLEGRHSPFLFTPVFLFSTPGREGSIGKREKISICGIKMK